MVLSGEKLFQSLDNNDRFETSDIVLKKIKWSIPALMFQIIIVCYLFDKLNKQVIYIALFF